MTRRVAKSLRAMAEELLRKADELDAADGNVAKDESRMPPQKPGPKDHEKAARALRRAGVYPRGAWTK